MLDSTTIEETTTTDTVYTSEQLDSVEIPSLTPTETVLAAVATFSKTVKTSGKKATQLKELQTELSELNDELLNLASGNVPTDPERDMYFVAAEHKRVSAKENKLSQDVSPSVIEDTVSETIAALEAYLANL